MKNNLSLIGEVLALIPARGGSKSVPRKNILPLLGKPLIYWSIKVAFESNLINRVIVSTDDKEIAEIAKSFKAEVIMRPKDISHDFSRDFEFINHAVNYLYEEEKYVPNMIVNLRPTTPSRDPLVIDEAIKYFSKNHEADSLRSIHLADQSPYKMWMIDNHGLMQPLINTTDICEPYNTPRQLLPLVYWQDGYVDITWTRNIIENRSSTGTKILPFIIKDPSKDLDYPDQIPEVEAQLSTIKKTKNNLKNNTRHPS